MATMDPKSNSMVRTILLTVAKERLCISFSSCGKIHCHDLGAMFFVIITFFR